MIAYCKTCHSTHAAWNRLNDGAICGLCGTRERDSRVVPPHAQVETNPEHLNRTSHLAKRIRRASA